jgi:hypothetical protein
LGGRRVVAAASVPGGAADADVATPNDISIVAATILKFILLPPTPLRVKKLVTIKLLKK